MTGEKTGEKSLRELLEELEKPTTAELRRLKNRKFKYSAQTDLLANFIYSGNTVEDELYEKSIQDPDDFEEVMENRKQKSQKAARFFINEKTSTSTKLQELELKPEKSPRLALRGTQNSLLSKVSALRKATIESPIEPLKEMSSSSTRSSTSSTSNSSDSERKFSVSHVDHKISSSPSVVEENEPRKIIRQESIKLPRSSFPLKEIPPFRQKSVDYGQESLQNEDFSPKLEQQPNNTDELTDIKRKLEELKDDIKFIRTSSTRKSTISRVSRRSTRSRRTLYQNEDDDSYDDDESRPVTQRTTKKVLEKIEWAANRLDDSENLNHTINLMNLIKSSSDALAALQKTEIKYDSDF